MAYLDIFRNKLASLLNRCASALKPENVHDENHKSATERHTTNSEARRASLVTRTIVDLSDPLLHEYHQNQKENTALERKNQAIAISAVVGALILVAIGMIQACVTRDTERRQLRAYIAVDIPDHALSPPINQPTLHLNIRNTGQTPALRVEHVTGIDIRPYPLPRDNDFSIGPVTTLPEPVTVFPGNLAVFGISEIPKRPFTPAQSTEVQIGNTKRLYIWGTVNYSDVFENSHYTNFCFSIDGIAQLATPYHFEACDQHNDSN